MGEEAAFDQVFRRYYARLCDFSERYVRNKVDAEEAIEKLFVNLWHKKPVFESEEHARAFLYRAAYNGSLNILRDSQRQLRREEAFGLKSDLTEESYLNNLLRSELMGIIYEEIEKLPEQYARVIKMSYREGLKNEEIAAVLGLSLQTVKNYKTKGLLILRTRMPFGAWLVLWSGVLHQMPGHHLL
ncbi:RNA polymerase sigma-70 factor [Chitinophaga qingshengii]|uniref:RNA polymerase sigma-70 factor n=1 Tax=Chitinophaga qingshengii TaxID=1569794 RepID=A0ABR7TG60_9BACT|nr:RNA polymerase sigma-70 factor [Chitinophaga qingshengii]MBC9929401.1 RNA polymerase sigma-70 factor [Chitinophaga qingshengii]